MNRETGKPKYQEHEFDYLAEFFRPALDNKNSLEADSYMMHQFEAALLKGGKKAPCDLKASLRMTLPGLFALKSALNGGNLQKNYYPWDSDWSDFLRSEC